MKPGLRAVLLVVVLLVTFGIVEPLQVAAHPPINAPVQFQGAGGPTSCRVAIKAQKQGQFPGTAPGRPDKWIPCTQFLMSVSSPRDASSGMANGRRQYTPVVITKEWDAASPLIMNAAGTNEVLTLVEFEFLKTNAQGAQFAFETIRLTNATISGVKRYIGFPDSGEPPNPHSLEDISFTFQKIEVVSTEGRTTFSDDWNVAR